MVAHGMVAHGAEVNTVQGGSRWLMACWLMVAPICGVRWHRSVPWRHRRYGKDPYKSPPKTEKHLRPSASIPGPRGALREQHNHKKKGNPAHIQTMAHNTTAYKQAHTNSLQGGHPSMPLFHTA